jgi:hypothetical protein
LIGRVSDGSGSFSGRGPPFERLAVRFKLVVDFGLDRRSAAALLLEELRA